MITPDETWEEFLVAHDRWEAMPCQQTKMDLQRCENAMVTALWLEMEGRKQ